MGHLAEWEQSCQTLTLSKSRAHAQMHKIHPSVTWRDAKNIAVFLPNSALPSDRLSCQAQASCQTRRIALRLSATLSLIWQPRTEWCCLTLLLITWWKKCEHTSFLRCSSRKVRDAIKLLKKLFPEGLVCFWISKLMWKDLLDTDMDIDLDMMSHINIFGFT